MFSIQSITNDIASAVTEKLNAIDSGSSSTQASELRAVIASILRKMQVVSRDEFDAQAAVLLRTRNKLEQLEKQVAILEAANLPQK